MNTGTTYLPPNIEEEPVLPAYKIQGDILLGFNKKHLHFLFFDVTDKRKAKEWLRTKILDKITTVSDIEQFRAKYVRPLAKGEELKENHNVLNVAFSYAGLQALEAKDVDKFDPWGAFRIGMANRSSYLGDLDPETGEPYRKTWVVGAEREPHIMIQVGSDDKNAFKEFVEKTVNEADCSGSTFTYEDENMCLKAMPCASSNAQTDSGVKLVHSETGTRIRRFNELKFGRKVDEQGDQFGFQDGISNPAVRGYIKLEKDSPDKQLLQRRFLKAEDERYNLYGRPGQELVWPGEFLLGQKKEGDFPCRPNDDATFAGPSWAKNGSFISYRRMQQLVPEFWNFAYKAAEDLKQQLDKDGVTYGREISTEFMASMMLGRWPSGAPIVLSPNYDDPQIGKHIRTNNAFRYNRTFDPALKLKNPTTFDVKQQADPLALVCPFAAHVRKMNPRDQTTDIGSTSTLRRRIIRRGKPFGKPYKFGDQEEGSFQPDGVDRGLHFICYQSSLDLQFEFLIREWANREFQPAQGGFDMIIGQAPPGTDKKFAVNVAVTADDGSLSIKEYWVNAGKTNFTITNGGGYFLAPTTSAVKRIAS